jgi:acyl-CoA thioester hydrolase
LDTSDLDGYIRDGHHHMKVRVYFEDTDFTGITYHANYLRFMERGRTNYLRLLGASHRDLFEETATETPGFTFVVRSMQIDFFKAAVMDDVLDIITAPVEVRGASIALRQECRHSNRALSELSMVEM